MEERRLSDKQNASDPAIKHPDMEDIDRQLRSAGLSFPHVTPVEMRFMKIVKPFREMGFRFPKLDPKKATKLVSKLISNGELEWELNGRSLNWVMGLSAFCGLDGDNVIAGITEAYGDACVEIYRVAMDDVEAFDDTMLYDEDLDPYEAKHRGVYLAPDLPIVDRQYIR